MSDENKNDEEETRTYSKSFEEFEMSQFHDPIAKLYFGILKTMSPEFQDKQSEETRKLMTVADVFEQKMNEVMSTSEGREMFVKRLKEELGD